MWWRKEVRDRLPDQVKRGGFGKRSMSGWQKKKKKDCEYVDTVLDT